MKNLYEITKKQNDNIIVITPVEFIKRIKKNIAKTNSLWIERE